MSWLGDLVDTVGQFDPLNYDLSRWQVKNDATNVGDILSGVGDYGLAHHAYQDAANPSDTVGKAGLTAAALFGGGALLGGAGEGAGAATATGAGTAAGTDALGGLSLADYSALYGTPASLSADTAGVGSALGTGGIGEGLGGAIDYSALGGTSATSAPAYSGPGSPGAGAGTDAVVNGTTATGTDWAGGLKTGLQYLNTANQGVNFARNPTVASGLGLAGSVAGLSGAADGAPVGGADPGAVDAAGAAGAAGGATDAASQTTGVPSTAPQYSGVGSAGAGAGTDAAVAAGGAAPSTTQQAIDALSKGAGSAWSGVKSALPVVNNGLAAAAIIKNMQQGSQAQKQYQAIAKPTQDVSNQLLNQFKSGQVTGADAFAIQDWQQKQTASLDQYYAKAGLSNSSMHEQAKQQVAQQAEQMRQQAVQNLLKNGLSAAGISNPTLVQGVNAGLQQDQQAQQNMQAFIKMLAQMNTPDNSTKPAPAPATP